MHWLATILVSIGTGIRAGILEMRTHLLRSLLSATGITFGVFVLVAMLSLMGGLNSFIENNIGQWLGSIWMWEQRDLDPEHELTLSRSPGLTFSDGVSLEQESDAVEKVYKLIRQKRRVEIAGKEQKVHLKGVDAVTLEKEFETGGEIAVVAGHSFSHEEYLSGAKACLVSQSIADKASSTIIDQTVRVGTELFKIVGVYNTTDGSKLKRHKQRSIYIPLRAMQKYLSGFNPNPGYVWMQVADPLKMQSSMADIRGHMIARHRGVEDVEYSMPDHLNEYIAMMKNINLIMGILAFVALISGGLGIMNVMLSSISERVKEIGIRKALGATTLQIFIQFISESVMLCTLGGFVGAVFGVIPILIGDEIKKATGGTIKPELQLEYVVLIVVLIGGLGIVCGLYPALKASRMNPIDALRYE